MKLEFKSDNDTPVFFIDDSATSSASRVFGATFFKKENRWYFPAFPPFHETVLRDIRNVYPGIELSAAAESSIRSNVPEAILLDDVRKLTLMEKNFAHQDIGLTKILHNYRYILQWKMGTGKTKVLIDAINQLGMKTLVLCPAITINVWMTQIARFAPNLRVVAMNGTSPKQKTKQLEDAVKNADVLVVSYDTARLYGIPTVAPLVLSRINKASMSLPLRFKDVLARMRETDTQLGFVDMWITGTPIADVILRAEDFLKQAGPQYVTDFPYRMFVADESHRVKRLQSKRTKVAMKLSERAARRYLLTGTLSQGDPRDLYPQLKILAPYLIPENWMQFQTKFVTFAPWNKHIVSGYKNLHILNARTAGISDIKTLEECVDMPPRVQENIMFELTPEQINDYNHAVKEFSIEMEKGTLDIANSAVRIMKLLQVCSGFVYAPEPTTICDGCMNLMTCVKDGTHPGDSGCTQVVEVQKVFRYSRNPKLGALKELLEDLLADKDNKAIIWGVLRAELEDIGNLLQEMGVRYVQVDGSNSTHAGKKAMVFEGEPDCRVYLGQVKTGISVTLNAGQYMIYYSRPWSLDDWEQSLGRNYRIGQNKKTVVYRLCAAESIEMQQLLALDNRQDIAKLLTTRVDCFLCDHYERCLRDVVEPWSNGCVLSSKKSRSRAVVKQIKTR